MNSQWSLWKTFTSDSVAYSMEWVTTHMLLMGQYITYLHTYIHNLLLKYVHYILTYTDLCMIAGMS